MIPCIALGLSALLALADSSALVAVNVIRAGDVVTTANAMAENGDVIAGDSLLGREVQRTIYVGHAITFENTRPARLVRRNQIVTVKYIRRALEITTTGRAMGEAGMNDPVSVLNLQSRQQVEGIVQKGGWVLVQ